MLNNAQHETDCRGKF